MKNMTNAEWCIKNGYKFSDLWIVRDCLDDDDDDDIDYLDDDEYEDETWEYGKNENKN